jgi:hypothetical protein
MRRMLLGLGAFALTLTTAVSAANAGEFRGHEAFRHEAFRHEVIGREVAHRYFETHGVRFAGGYYYPGFDHHHWGRQVWDARLARWEFWDADLGCYFYWNATLNGYYPVTYICP